MIEAASAVGSPVTPSTNSCELNSSRQCSRTGSDESPAGRLVDGIVLAEDGDLAHLRAAGRDGVVAATVVDVAGLGGDVPERLQPALAGDELDIVGLGALKQAAQPRTERANAAVHRPLADLVDRQAFVEDEDVFIRELDLHAALLRRAERPRPLVQRRLGRHHRAAAQEGVAWRPRRDSNPRRPP